MSRFISAICDLTEGDRRTVTTSPKRKSDDIERGTIGERVKIYRRGKVWWLSYQINRTQHRKSLDTTNRKEARRQAGIIALELHAGTHEIAPPPICLEDVIREYLEHLKVEGKSARTLTKYKQVYDRFQVMAAERGVRVLNQINIRFIDWYRSQRSAAGRAPKTIQNAMTIIRQLVNFALSRKILSKG